MDFTPDSLVTAIYDISEEYDGVSTSGISFCSDYTTHLQFNPQAVADKLMELVA